MLSGDRALLEKLLPVYQPDAVFLAYVVNDAERSTAMPTPPEEVYRHSRSWFLTEVAERLNRRVFKRRVLPSAKDNVGSNYLDGFEEGSVKWRDSREAIREMRDLSAGPFAILMMPDFTQEFDDRYALRQIHDAVASFGRRPTVAENGAPMLESFLLDFSDDLYGERCQVSFFGFLRSEEKFDGLDALVAQMRRDEAEARALLSSVRPLSGLDAAIAF